MKDILGRELKVGDLVAYVYGKKASAKLKVGNITKIYDNDKECSVDENAHIYDFRILKI